MRIKVGTMGIWIQTGLEAFYWTIASVWTIVLIRMESVQHLVIMIINSDNRLLGIAFDKVTPDNYYDNCDTFATNFDNPGECRWHDCHLPSSISAAKYQVQMTVAIYICALNTTTNYRHFLVNITYWNLQLASLNCKSDCTFIHVNVHKH